MTETIDFSQQKYSNAQVVTSTSGNVVLITFTDGCKYYTTGSAIRIYGEDCATFTANNNTITKVKLTFSGTSNAPSSNDERTIWNPTTGSTVSNDRTTWEGSATSVSITRPSGSGHWRLQKAEITYETSGGSTPSLDPSDFAITDAPVALSFDLYNNSAAQTVNFTTSSEGAVTVSESEYVTTSVSGNTITVTPVKVTPSAQTITINQAADETYAAGTATFTVSIDDSTPAGDYKWVETNLSDLTTSDVFVIVGNNGSNFAMSNDNGASSAPTAVSVTVAEGKITSNVATTIQWTVSGNATDGYTFYPNGSTTTWLYCTNNNNGVRVGDNTNKTFTIDNGYLKHGGTSRYVGIYNSSDWRCYTSINSNIEKQTFKFYKRVDASSPETPSISANNVNLAFDATSGTISYTITNPIDGTNLMASSNASWLTVGTPADGNIALTCEANTDEARTATVTLTYGSVSKTVTVTQAAAPVVYSTIPALFAAATETATDVDVTFNNWVVSGVSTNGKNVFITDNNGNGFMIFNNAGGLDETYSVGKILSGSAVACKLVLYNGFAEITNLDAADLTITDGGSVTTSDIALANLSGVNTGALVSYEGLTCSIDGGSYYLSDGTTSIQVYNSLYAFGSALENGKKYNITGIYQQYNAKKEILPRSAADIEEVLEASITVSSTSVSAPANGAEGIITVTYNNITDVVAEVKFVAADGTTAATYDWVEAQIDEDNNLSYIVSANTNTTERKAYVKIYALDDNGNDVYSDLITITQAGFVADYATLPFEYDNTGAMITDVTGLTGEGLGSYTSGSPAIKFDTTNDYLILKMNEAPKALYFNIKGNDFSGGTFKVQTSADGTTYSDLATYTELTSAVQTELFTNIATDVRYIKWIYTNKSKGNVALGKIIATNVLPTENVSVGSTGFATFSCDKALDFTGIENIYAYTATVSGKEISFTRVYQVPANTGLLLRNPAEEAATANVPVIASATLSGENALVAVSEEIASLPSENSDGSKNYILNKPSDKNVGFFLAAGKKVGANKAYLKVPAGVSAVKSFAEVFGGETDGVEAIENGQWTIDNAVIYNLAGQRLQKLQRGVNIVGGKKVVVK